MKKIITIISITLSFCLNAFSQATSLTIDCQTPGWLSSKINYGDQQTLENIKVTGYINGTDLQFILDLNTKHSLIGVIDLEDVHIVSGGTTVEKDNILPSRVFGGGRYVKKIILPSSLEKYNSNGLGISGDSLIIPSSLQDISFGQDDFKYTQMPEGVEQIYLQGNKDRIRRCTLPNSISIFAGSPLSNLVLYSFIENPEVVSAQFETYYNVGGQGYRNYWAIISNSTFFIPKGTYEKYLKSDFAALDSYRLENGNYIRINNGNKFIEYYDIDSTIVKSPLNLYVGDIAPIDVKIYPNDSLVSWINYLSANSEIANVQSDGTIVAKGYGQTEVFATPHVFIDGLETKTGSCVVNVLAHVEGIDMPTTMSLHIGEQKAINAKTLPLDITDSQLSYVSNDSSIATVTNDGFVVGHKRGTCSITATSADGGYEATCEVTVTQPVEALTMEKHSIKLKVGESERLFAQISPATADDKTISWLSSNNEIASVDENGNVTAKKAGEAWINAISNDNSEAKDSCIVTVSQPVTGIQLDNTTYFLNGIGKSFELKATVVPDDASNKNVKWKSSDESVCVVSQGLVVAVGLGTCVIIATTEDGGYMATCTVTVNKTTDISTVSSQNDNKYQIFDANGSRRNSLQQGVNIIRFVDGTKKKVIIR